MENYKSSLTLQNISTSFKSLKFFFYEWQFLNSLGIRIAPFCAFFLAGTKVKMTLYYIRCRINRKFIEN